MQTISKLRLSRPTNNLENVLRFYCEGLGFEVLDRYEAQQGWDGVIVGHKDWPYQFEFSRRRDGAIVPPAPTTDHFFVFCVEDPQQWETLLKNLFQAGFSQITPPQLYADSGVATFEDPEGYRVVLVQGHWKK